MKISYLTLGGVALLAGITATSACSSDPAVDDGDGSGGAGAAGGGVVGPGPGPGPGSGGSGGGTTGDGNDSFDEAAAISLGDGGILGDLEHPEDYDYYVFTGTAGQAITIGTDAKPDADPFADGYPDLVVTLYEDQNGTPVQIAENDDPIPRNTQDSELWTVLPNTGTYYIRVGDFCWWAEDETGTNPCPGGMQDFSVSTQFSVGAAEVDFTQNSFVDETEGGTMEYEPNMTGTYFASVVKGTFDDASDVDTYTLNIPADVVASTGRLTAYLDVFPTGVDGNGSSSPTGSVWFSTDPNPTVTPYLAQIDATKLDTTFGMTVEVPIAVSTTYYMHVDSNYSAGNPFYYLWHGMGGSNPVETTPAEDASSIASPSLNATLDQSSTGADVYWFSGDIANDNDVDVFVMNTNADGVNTAYNIFGSCAGQRIGSGVRGLQWTLTDGNGVAVTGGQVTEDPDTDVSFGANGIAFPAGATDLALRVETTATQATEVGGGFYRCSIFFLDPAAN